MKKFIFFSITGFLLFTGGCSKDEPADCGCGEGSEVVFTIEDSDEQIGYLYKADESYSNPHLPKYKYAIWFSEDGCGNCVHTFFVCNNFFLSDFEGDLTYPGVEVKFSGQAKELCEDPVRLADYTYNYIILTRVESY